MSTSLATRVSQIDSDEKMSRVCYQHSEYNDNCINCFVSNDKRYVRWIDGWTDCSSRKLAPLMSCIGRVFYDNNEKCIFSFCPSDSQSFSGRIFQTITLTAFV